MMTDARNGRGFTGARPVDAGEACRRGGAQASPFWETSEFPENAGIGEARFVRGAWADVLPACARRYYSPGFGAYGGAVSPGASGGYLPGEDAGFYCTLTGEPCSFHPPDCPEWRETALVCPACIAFKTRLPRREFEERRLVSRNGAYYCPECHESYPSLTDVALAALNSLRDALDDADYATRFHREIALTDDGVSPAAPGAAFHR